MPYDIDKPLTTKEPTLPELMERVARATERILEIQQPGVRGIEGTEVVPECTIETVTLQPGQRFHVGANRRRKTLLITISQIQTAEGAQLNNMYLDISTRDGWEQPGYALDSYGTFELNNSTNSIYIRPLYSDGTDALWPTTVTIVQENS